MKRISLLILFLLFFATAFQSDKLITQGWYQQFFPNLNGSSITSITFLDSLTGYAVTNTNSTLQAYILKTTNGGDNWNINYTYTQTNSNWNFVKIGFVDSNTGYAFGWTEMFRTTNGGANWEVIINNLYANDIAIINKDTMLAVKNSGFNGGVYRSTNGGYNWQAMGPTGGSGQPSTIYMYNKNMGFCLGGEMRKTTNGGVNWFAIPGETYTSIMFVDSLTGWKCYDSIKKTTNGGLNWFSQQTPNVSQGFWGPSSFSAINKDTVWMVGALSNYTNPVNPIYKTTNGGLNWGYQNADSTHIVGLFGFIQFVNDKVGWAKSGGQTYELHTVTGGNVTTFFTGIKLVPSIVPEKYSLGQNYPNPFNPTTNIPFELKEPSHVTLKVFDARGREVKELVNGRWGTGKFIADFNVHLGGSATIATGIYFYQIIVSGESTHQIFTETRKMMFLK
ncbi:MAG: YCF48-related protein [Ignavibacteriae bacterium]|nr:YCF48-related protein [Ignavibacteriota bacterium]